MAVQSIERAFVLLRTIAEYPDGISVTDLARRTSLHKSTVSRLIMSLESERAVERVRGNLRIGHGIAELMTSSMRPSTLVALARPYLRRLAQRLDETAGLCMPEGNRAYFIDQILTSHFIQVRDWTGERYPLHAVSSGKVFLAYSAASTVEHYLYNQPLTAFTERTITDPEVLRDHLEEIRERGYDWSFEEFNEGLAVIAAPIFGRQNQVLASIYVCGPSFRFPPAGRHIEITECVIETCKEISGLITTGTYGVVDEATATS